MTIYYDPDKFLLERFNANNGFALYREHVVFNNPRSTAIVDPPMADKYNTIIDVVMQPGAMFDGVTQMYYNRINLAHEFANSRLLDVNYLSINDEKTIHEIIPRLNLKFGLALTTDEVVDGPIRDAGLFTLVNVKAISTSKRYYNSFNINVMRSSGGLAVVDIKHEATTEWDISRKVLAPAGYTDYPLHVLNYNIDYTSIAGQLRTIKPKISYHRQPQEMGHTTLALHDWLPMALTSVDGIGWSAASTVPAGSAQNLYQAAVVYNGPVKDCRIPGRGMNYRRPIADDSINPANPAYDNVLALLMWNPSNSKTRYKSLALFHYNEV